MRGIYLSLVLATATANGCGRSAPTEAPGPSPTYRFEVRAADGAHKQGESDPFSLTVGKTVVSTLGGRLTVDGKSFGKLQDGDEIRVNEDGRVTVNGEARQPE